MGGVKPGEQSKKGAPAIAAKLLSLVLPKREHAKKKKKKSRAPDDGLKLIKGY